MVNALPSDPAPQPATDPASEPAMEPAAAAAASAAPAPADGPAFSSSFDSELQTLLLWRRDVRHFRTTPLPAGALAELVELACLAPSVGFSQPWRFVRVREAERRARVRASFEVCNAQALTGYAGEQAALYARLKLSGLDDAPEHLAIFADRGTAQGAGLGRLTMPEKLEYSVVCAIHTLWLAARARGIGVGWVSILDPLVVGEALGVPAEWRLVGYLCLGYAEREWSTPELQRLGWEKRRAAATCLLER